MSSLFRKPAPSAPATYLPDAAKVWGRTFLLRPDPERNEFDLWWARDLFDLDDRHPDKVSLRFDDGARQAVLVFGPHSEVRSAPLAPYEAFRRVQVLRYRYRHERDWPAEDEDVVGMRVELRASNRRRLRFHASDYAKFDSAYQQPSFVTWLEGLAGRLGCPIEVKHANERPEGW